MLIDHHDQQIVRRRTQNLELCLGPTWGPTKQKLRKPRLLEQFCSDQPTARRETHWLARRQNVEGPAAAQVQWSAFTVEYTINFMGSSSQMLLSPYKGDDNGFYL